MSNNKNKNSKITEDCKQKTINLLEEKDAVVMFKNFIFCKDNMLILMQDISCDETLSTNNKITYISRLEEILRAFTFIEENSFIAVEEKNELHN